MVLQLIMINDFYWTIILVVFVSAENRKKIYMTLGTSNKETIKNYHTSVYDNCRYSDLEKISLTIDPNPSEG